MMRRVLPHAGAVALLDARTAPLFEASEGALLCELSSELATAIVLLPWIPPPQDKERDDGLVCSFLCTKSVLDELVVLYAGTPDDRLCFCLFDAILNGRLTVPRLLVRQLPYREREVLHDSQAGPAALLMPHRGSPAHLRVALAHLPESDMLRIRVGLDMEDVGEYSSLAALHDHVEFFRAFPAPAGPYLIRQRLAGMSSEPSIIFQDSDDVSTSDRFSSLRAALTGTDRDLVGCHELRVNEITGEVRAFRFPLDVTRALRQGFGHSLLLATCIIGRDAFFSAGGYSTDQTISYDTQFILRAFFHLRIRNVDQFLYIRRKHAASLTELPHTAIGSDFRRGIERPWTIDFEAIKRGELALSESSLESRRSVAGSHLIPFGRA